MPRLRMTVGYSLNIERLYGSGIVRVAAKHLLRELAAELGADSHIDAARTGALRRFCATYLGRPCGAPTASWKLVCIAASLALPPCRSEPTM